MKKFLMTLIVTLAFCGSIFAQHPETNWPGFNNGPYEMQGALYASIMVNGEPVTTETANWDVMEVAAYVGDDPNNPELRMVGMYLTDEYLIYGELFPTLNAEPIYYTTPGEEIHFLMFNHATGDLYTVCEPLIWDGDPITILSGEEHWEGFDDPDHPLMLNFIGEAGGIDKTITKYETAGWYLISSPVGTVEDASTVTNLVTGNYNLYKFDQSQEKEWLNYDGDTELDYDGGFALEQGKGYLYGNGETVTITFTGTAFTADELVVPLEYSDDNADENIRGWNLVGNPFNSKASLGNVPYYRMEDGALVPKAAGTLINEMEGVFVLASEAGQSVTFTPAEESKEVTNLALSLSDGNKVVDRAIVSFGQGSNLPKFQLDRNSSKLYIPMDNEDYAVVRSEGMGEMPVSFKAQSNGTYSLNLTTENVDFSYLHLIDNLTGADQDLLANPSYSFSANTTDYASRFRLVFATGNDQDSFAFFSNGTLFINNEGNATLQVVDVTGRIIKCQNINGCANVSIDAAPGVYMVRLLNGDNMKVQKVVK